MKLKKSLKVVLIFLLSAFGILTVFLTGSVLLDLFGIRAKEGNFVPFIVWINLVAGIGYLAAAYLLFNSNRKSILLLLGIAILILIGNIALHFHITSGGIYKMETVNGMRFRLVVTFLMAFLSNYILKQTRTNHE